MANNIVGSVAAEIILDTEQFETAIKDLKSEVESIKETFNKKTGGNDGLVSEVKKLKEEIDSLRSKTEDYKKTINSLREQLKKGGFKDASKEIKELKNALKEVQTLKITPNGLVDFQKNWHRVTLQVKKDAADIKGAMEKFAPTNFMPSNLIVDESKMTIRGISTAIKELGENYNRLSYEANTAIESMSKSALLNETFVPMEESFQKTQSFIKYIHTGFNELSQSIVKTTEVLTQFNFKLLEGIDKESIFYQRTTHLASAMQKMNVQGTGNWQGRNVTGGYSTYISQSNAIAETLKKQAQAAKEAKYATEGLSQAYSKINLNSYKSNISQINQALDQQRLRTAQLEAAQASLYYKNAPNNLNTYKMNMDQINQSLERQTNTHKKNNSELKRGQMSMREFGTTMGKAEAYSNNLYRGLQKVRSVIVSMKTIIGAFGGMAVFSFVSDLIEGAKETYSAKSEMESLLNQNNKVTAEGQKLFNQELDNTIGKFQKINKYSLGETASSIGLEFNLDAKQMAESLDAIAMIQSEYARAGRSNEEAALAVKDILQGEFRRLSMETGIGEEELTEKYGWSGAKEDVVGLMDALRKAGKDRHWDVFAAKATSVGDIVNITKSRFSEFGAELITTIEPAIVSGFNGMIEILDGAKKAFDGMSSFGKVSTIAGLGGGAFVGISTALMMFKRNMGLAEIATLGWGRSFMTALLGLNKADVAVHGFLKTLTATISGTKASTVANIGLTKSVLGRIAGVKHEIQAEHGLASAIMARKVELEKNLTMEKAAIIESGNLRQKIIYLAKGEVVADKASASWGKTLKSLITSTKLLRLAVLGLTSIAIISWFAGVMAYTDRCKKAMDNLNNINANGVKISENAQKQVDKYTNKLSELTEGTKKYNEVKKQLDIANANKEDIDKANELLSIHKRDYEGYKKSIDERRKARIDESLQLASDGKKGLPTTNYEFQMQQAIKVRNHALEEYDTRLYKASQHINEHVSLMKQAGASEQKRLDYVREYQAEAENTAQLWKKFHEGDLTSGLYALLSEAKLLWIDLWNNEHFVNFWHSVNQTWKEIKPTLDWIVARLGDLGNTLLDFFSTKQGQIIGGVAALGLGFGVIGTKLYHILGGSKSTIDILKTVKDKLKDTADGWRKVNDEAKEANKTMGGDTSTGGIKGDKGGTGSLKTDLKEIGKTRIKSFVNNALILAEGMFLVTEAILLIKAPMGALAEVGNDFKRLEPNIRNGIEGLKLVSPIIIGFFVPIIALHQVLSRFGGFMSSWSDLVSNLKAFATMALGIAAGMFLVAEAIVMIVPSIWALGALGDQYAGIEPQVKKGTQAMKIVSDSLNYLLPFIPALAGGILLGVAIFESGPIGAALSLAVVGGIAIGMGLVAEAIYLLQAPLWAIGEVGKNFKDLSNVQAGANAIKLSAEALKYVSDAMAYLTLIDIGLLAQNIADVVAKWLGVDLNGKLTDLTGEGGVIPQLNQFAKDFNKLEFEAIDQAKVSALATAGDGVGTVGTAMQKVKTAMDNLPDEFKNPTSTLNYNTETDKTTIATEDTTGYFDAFKEPLKQLKDFVHEFNTSEDFNIETVDTARIDAINSAASMISQINTAVENVKTALGNVGDAQWNTAYAEGGIFAAAGNFLFHQTGLDSINNGSSSGGYKSSLGSSLKAMEDVISDMFTFQSNISKYGGEGGESPDVGGLSSLITNVEDAISKLSTSLSNSIPTIKENGKSLGSAVVNGVKEGLTGIGEVGTGIPPKIANGIMNNKDMVYNTSNSLGKTTASKFKEGVDPMSEYMTWELSYVKEAMTSRYDELGQTAYDLGSHIAARFKEGDDINSPGIMARAIQDEVGYIEQSLSVNNLPQLAFDLANALSSNFQVDFNLSNLQLPDMTQWASKLSAAIPIVESVKTQVSTKFEGMKTNVQNSFNNITSNARNSMTNIQTNMQSGFNNIVGKTRNSMANMQSTTVSHIGNIKSSWYGMQDALIASAEHIKSETTSKIDTLKSNLGDFWNKVKNPELLIGSAGPINHQGSIRRRSRPHFNVQKGNYAGGFNFRPQRSRGSPSDLKDEYLKCMLETGKPCYAGWGFDWSNNISNRFKGWKTHFGRFHLDDYLNVGKFENSNFPVRGNADVAKAYIYDVIASTKYGSYFNSHFGDDPVAALKAGVFNCWDGANIILAIARAFGFYGSMGHGSWNGIGHVWAAIPGLGNIDATAIQGGYGFTSPKVTGYAGSIKRGRSSSVPDGAVNNNTHNEVHIHIDGPVYGVDDLNDKIEEGARRVARSLFRNSYSGV